MALLHGALAFPASLSAAAKHLDPTGTWNCVVYGRPGLGDERLKFSLYPDGRAAQSRSADDAGPWVPLSGWQIRRNRLQFSDPRTGRQYEADLDFTTLGGTWKTESLVGGWWCSSEQAGLADESPSLRRSGSAAVAARLVPQVTATPRYPTQAIREAKEGRAVVCFLVNNEGHIIEPQFVELSDEIFRESTLQALERSRYRAWQEQQAYRPGCRSFIFRLDAIR